MGLERFSDTSPIRFSRRRLLAATAAGMVTATAHGPLAVLAQTPAATPTIPNLTGVAPRPLTGDHLATYQAYVATKLAAMGVPGAAVAVVQGGAVVFLQGFGVRELGRPAPVTADTLLRIGSVTKSFSSFLTATLVDAGQVRWDTPLVDLLPTFAVANPALTPRLTIRDAFTAATGLPRRDWEFQFNAAELTPEKVIASIRQLPLTAPYGTKYQYNNQMVAAGGYAAAVADGGAPNDLGPAYATALRERVLNPIGMARSTLALADVLADDDYATPHAADITGALRPLPLLEDDTWIVPVAPSGGLWSSAREMARYVQTELARGVAPDGGQVVSAANLDETWKPGVASPAPPGTPSLLAALAEHYGLGWAVGTYFGQRLISHAGGTFGFGSLLTLLPDADLGVVALTNTLSGALFNVTATFRLLELLFAQPAAIDAELAPGLAAAARGRANLLAQLGQVDPTAVSPYLGRYANPHLGEATIALRAGQLIFEAGNFHSALQPQRDAAGAVAGYLPVDPPLASPLQFTVTFHEGATGKPQLVLTVPADPGEADLVYPYTSVGPAATPAP